MIEEKFRVFTDFTIIRKNSKSIKAVFDSIRRNLPAQWKHRHDLKYDDRDVILIVKDAYCVQTPIYLDNEDNTKFQGQLWIGLLNDSIRLLRVDGIPKEKIYVRGWLIHAFQEKVLARSKYFEEIEINTRYGGETDANWRAQEIRGSRPIVLFSKKENTLFSLLERREAIIEKKSFTFTPPNNISLSLSLAKKNYNAAKTTLNLLKKAHPSIGGEENTNAINNIIYDYLEQLQAAVIFSYTAIEAFTNAVIPEDFSFEKFNEKGIKEIWSKANIERWMSTSDKLGDIIPGILNASELKDKPFWSMFKELEKLRNELIHQRTIKNNTEMDSEYLNKMLESHVYQMIESTFEIINFFFEKNEQHPYFPLGLGVSKIEPLVIESMEAHFQEL